MKVSTDASVIVRAWSLKTIAWVSSSTTMTGRRSGDPSGNARVTVSAPHARSGSSGVVEGHRLRRREVGGGERQCGGKDRDPGARHLQGHRQGCRRCLAERDRERLARAPLGDGDHLVAEEDLCGASGSPGSVPPQDNRKNVAERGENGERNDGSLGSSRR